MCNYLGVAKACTPPRVEQPADHPSAHFRRPRLCWDPMQRASPRRQPSGCAVEGLTHPGVRVRLARTTVAACYCCDLARASRSTPHHCFFCAGLIIGVMLADLCSSRTHQLPSTPQLRSRRFAAASRHRAALGHVGHRAALGRPQGLLTSSLRQSSALWPWRGHCSLQATVLTQAEAL